MSTPPDFPSLLQCLKDADATIDDPETAAALIAIRKAVSVETGVEDVITDLLALDPSPILRKYLLSPIHSYSLESGWILTNIASSTSAHCASLIDSGIYKDMCALLSQQSLSLEMIGQCSWAIGNICGEGAKYRDLLLNEGVAERLCHVFTRSDATNEFKKNMAWTIANLCRFEPPPKPHYLLPVISFIESVLKDVDMRQEDVEWLTEMLWGVFYVSEAKTSQLLMDHDFLSLIHRLFRPTVGLPGLGESEVIPRRLPCEQVGEVMEYLSNDHLCRLATLSKDVFQTTVCNNPILYSRLRSVYNITFLHLIHPVVRIIPNIISSTSEQTAVTKVLELTELFLSIEHLSNEDKSEILRAIVKLAAGRKEVCYEFCSKPHIVQAISEALVSDDRSMYKKAAKIISDLYATAPDLLLDFMVELTIPAIISYLDPARFKADKAALKAMVKISYPIRNLEINEIATQLQCEERDLTSTSQDRMNRLWSQIKDNVFVVRDADKQILNEVVQHLVDSI